MIERSADAFHFFEQHYWDYYIELEESLLQIRKYVSFSKKNFNTFSIEILKLYQAVCSEIDVIGKELARIANPEFKTADKKNNIYKWWYEIQDTLFVEEKLDIFAEPSNIELYKYQCRLSNDISFTPWKNFHVDQYYDKKAVLRYKLSEGCKLPKWWHDYNQVKHNRASFVEGSSNETNYCKANFGNLCAAFAALYVLEMAMLTCVATQDNLEGFADHSKLFEKTSFLTSADIERLFEMA